MEDFATKILLKEILPVLHRIAVALETIALESQVRNGL